MTLPKWACRTQNTANEMFAEMLHSVSLGCHQQMLQMPLPGDSVRGICSSLPIPSPSPAGKAQPQTLAGVGHSLPNAPLGGDPHPHLYPHYRPHPHRDLPPPRCTTVKAL